MLRPCAAGVFRSIRFAGATRSRSTRSEPGKAGWERDYGSSRDGPEDGFSRRPVYRNARLGSEAAEGNKLLGFIPAAAGSPADPHPARRPIVFGSRRGAAGCCVKAEVTDWWATNETHANRQENQWRCHLDVGVRIAARAAEICPRPTFATLRRSGRALGDYDPVRADTSGPRPHCCCRRWCGGNRPAGASMLRVAAIARRASFRRGAEGWNSCSPFSL